MATSLDVATAKQSSVLFHLTGRREGALDAVDDLGLRPALLAAHRDLTRLRYDFPLVLAGAEAQGGPVQSLSRIVDRLLQRVAPPGMTSEKLRRLVLRLEREIRLLCAQGTTGSLAELWDLAADRMQGHAASGDSVKIARAALDVDGEVIDCTGATAGRVLDHLWAGVREDKARRFRATAGRLAIKLDDILRADFGRSAAGRDPDRLSVGFGSPHRELFDFAAMSRLLPKARTSEELPTGRRKRVEWALSVITGQRFFAPSTGPAPARAALHSFCFARCEGALAAYRERLPEMAELIKAMAIAELEIDGRYVEARHDPLFAGFGANALDGPDLAMFPDYLVMLDGEAERSAVLEALASGVPLKVLVDIHDLHDGNADGPAPHRLPASQLAAMATSIDSVFVLQSTRSNLYRMRERIRSGLAHTGPALFCIYSGASAHCEQLPAYLNAAAALESRAFPSFTFDPAAGADLATRFSLAGNPQPERDWPLHRLDYADQQLGRASQEVAFTPIDFLCADRRNAGHFARMSAAQNDDRMRPAAQCIAAARNGETVPFVLAVNCDGMLARLIVDERMMQQARRCLESWHRLQELGGVHNSHAERLLAREKAEWEKRRQADTGQTAPPSPPMAPVVVPSASAPVATEATGPVRSPDEAYIETARCSSCNECIQINDRMFAYNDNKQAYIADLAAGTFRQLVEAAESCQLGVIHPGKPRDPGEPGLDELMERAATFA